MIGIDGDGFQPVTLQNCINGVIQTVTDDVQVNIVFFNSFYELRKKRVYRDLIQAIVQFVKTGIQKANLATHAFF